MYNMAGRGTELEVAQSYYKVHKDLSSSPNFPIIICHLSIYIKIGFFYKVTYVQASPIWDPPNIVAKRVSIHLQGAISGKASFEKSYMWKLK